MKASNSIQQSRIRNNYGIALVITLLVIVVLTIAVTAFMQSMSLERRTSQAYLNILLAEKAADAGLQKITSVLVGQTTNDYFTVLKVNDPLTPTVPYYFVGTPVDNIKGTGELKVKYTPLFSFQNNPTTTYSPVPTAALPNIPTIPSTDAATNKPVLPSNKPPVKTAWQNISTGSTAIPTIRYCYWTEDLAGYIDPEIAGNQEGAGSLHARGQGIDPKELALYSLFNPTAQTDPGDTAAKALLTSRGFLFSTDSIQQVIAGATPPPVPPPTADFLRDNLASDLRNDKEQNIIPHGFGYYAASDSGPGMLKQNLNTLIASKNVTEIAKTITDNLPIFATSRQGGLVSAPAPAQSYNKTLAANIIDYVDTDSDATTGVDYRGVDSYPFISEMYLEYKWIESKSVDGTFQHTITCTSWLELWNTSNKTASGIVDFEEINRQNITLGAEAYSFDTFSANPPTSTTGLPFLSQNVSIGPNGYRVVKMGTTTNVFKTTTFVASPVSLPANTNSNYKYYWHTAGAKILVDEARGGLDRLSSPLTLKGNPLWKGSAPGFVYSVANANYSDATGDPRASIYNNKPQSTISYTAGSSMGYRNFRANVGDTKSYGVVKPSRWSDGGHETGEPNPPAPPAATTEPSVTAASNYINNAPTVISNSGNLVSVAELGNIFDPARWKDTSDSRGADYYGFIANLPDTTAAQAAPDFGGGYTLRIGRPEHPKFDKLGTRASQLLDLFSTSDTTQTRGLVNLNTASADVLRTLAAGIKMQSDPGMVPGPLSSPAAPQFAPKSSASANEADIFVNAIIASRPFISTSQIAQVKDATGPAIGALQRYINYNATTWQWNDSAIEELFARLYGLTTVRSRNFRIYVTGQALNPQGRVVSNTNKVYEVFVQPIRDAAGKIISQKIQITYEKTL